MAGTSPNPGDNWVLHYLHKHGHMPAGWELVFGKPYYTGGKPPSERPMQKKRKLAATAVQPALRAESTRSADVTPRVLEVGRIPSPVGGTAKPRYTPFRANLASGDRLEYRHETKPDDCSVYDPACRDEGWESPTWIGGTDWVTSPLYRHPPPSAKKTFAQDPSGQIPADVDLPGSEGAHSMDEAILAFRLISESDPIGLISKLSTTAANLKKNWLSLSRSRPSGSSAVSPKPSGFMAKRNKRRRPSDDDDTPKVYSTRHKPGSPEHAAALYRQAIELRKQTGKTMYIVNYGGRLWVTAKPQEHGKIVHIVEATTSASFAPFFGRRGLVSIERARKDRLQKSKSDKCKTYDPECRDAEWEVPAANAGGLPLLRRQPLSNMTAR